MWLISTISSSSKKITSFVVSGKPRISELMALKLSDIPNTKGLPFFTAYIFFVSFTKNAKAYVPLINLTICLIILIGSIFCFSNLSKIKAIISESVSDLIKFFLILNFLVRYSKFSMIPLWTTAQLFFINGCVFTNEGFPCVAHLVWAIEIFVFILFFFIIFSKLFIFEMLLASINLFCTNPAIPHES